VDELRFWSDVSAILLVLQAFIVLAFLLVSLYFIVRGMAVVLRKTREYLILIRRYFGLLENAVVRTLDTLASPFILVASLSGALGEVLKNLWPDKR
jgi:hypothetical protein